MRTSQNGINLIKSFEDCRLRAYKCAAGVPTIGYGHTAGVKMGQTISQVQAESYLKDDLMKYETKVMKYYDKYRFNQNEFDALVSFAFNIGSIGALTAGGTRTRKVIAEKMLSYCKAAGRENAGLKERRKKERELFLTPVKAGSASTADPVKEPVSGNVQAAEAKKEESEEYLMKTIRKGSKGSAVKVWQIIVGAATDGVFGIETESRTKDWQKAHGLVNDGIVGKKTWKQGLESL